MSDKFEVQLGVCTSFDWIDPPSVHGAGTDRKPLIGSIPCLSMGHGLVRVQLYLGLWIMDRHMDMKTCIIVKDDAIGHMQ